MTGTPPRERRLLELLGVEPELPTPAGRLLDVDEPEPEPEHVAVRRRPRRAVSDSPGTLEARDN